MVYAYERKILLFTGAHRLADCMRVGDQTELMSVGPFLGHEVMLVLLMI